MVKLNLVFLSAILVLAAGRTIDESGPLDGEDGYSGPSSDDNSISVDLVTLDWFELFN